MTKYALMAAASVLLLASGSARAAMDCGATLDQHATAITKMTGAPPGKRAALHRMALSGYDHCIAGDEFNAKKYFEMISQQGKR